MRKIINGVIIILLLCVLGGCTDKNAKYTARFLSWDDSLITEIGVNTTVIEDIKNPPNAPERKGYTFEKWVGTFDSSTNVITIKAEYKIKTFTIEYNTAGGDLINDETHDFNTIITLPLLNRSGYDFGGWELNDEIVTEVTLTDNITVNAIWIPHGLEYIINDDNTVTIMIYNGFESDLVIPKKINGLPVNTIGEYAFVGSIGLTSVTIPESVTSIRMYAFGDCEDLKSVTIPESVTTIGSGAFMNCTSLTSITIPNSITNISSGLFSGCTNLTNITIPESVTSIGREAFRNCTGLTSITIPNSITSIERHAFRGCTGLTSITIPSNVTSIDMGAFAECTGLTNVTISNGVSYIGFAAFSGCTSLTSITIPKNVTTIESYVFSYCTNLTSITVDSGNEVYDSRENCNAIIESETNTLIIGTQNTTIPNTVTSLGNYAFEGCDNLTTITIPNTITSIGDSAFEGCTRLTSITIPSSVTRIGEDAFKGCIELAELIVDPNNSIYDSRGNSNALIETSTNTLIYGNSHTTIPNTVTRIGDYAFDGCSNLTMITIPNSVTSIGECAFKDCIGLTNITIPNSVTTIENGAFAGCTGLTSIIIPNSVTSMGSFVFEGCDNLLIFTKFQTEPSAWDNAWNIFRNPIYWNGEWHYDANGNPVPNN